MTVYIIVVKVSLLLVLFCGSSAVPSSPVYGLCLSNFYHFV